MFYIYSLNLQLTPPSLQLHNYSFELPNALLIATATEFIRSESGNRRAENAFIEPAEDGCFLKQPSSDVIEVFQRKTIISYGYLGAYASIEIKKIKIYSITEADFNFCEKFITTSSVKLETHKTQNSTNISNSFHDIMLDELTNVLKNKFNLEKDNESVISFDITSPPNECDELIYS